MITEAQRQAELAAIEEYIRTRGARRMPTEREIADAGGEVYLRYDSQKRRYTRAPIVEDTRNWGWR